MTYGEQHLFSAFRHSALIRHSTFDNSSFGILLCVSVPLWLVLHLRRKLLDLASPRCDNSPAAGLLPCGPQSPTCNLKSAIVKRRFAVRSSRCIHYGGLLGLLALLALFFVPAEPVALGQQPERSKQITELQKQIAEL